MVVGRVVIVFGNCRNAALRQIQNRLWKDVRPVKIGIMGVVPVARRPAGVHGEPQEIGEALSFRQPRRLTALQSAESFEIDWIRALGNQVGI